MKWIRKLFLHWFFDKYAFIFCILQYKVKKWDQWTMLTKVEIKFHIYTQFWGRWFGWRPPIFFYVKIVFHKKICTCGGFLCHTSLNKSTCICYFIFIFIFPFNLGKFQKKKKILSRMLCQEIEKLSPKFIENTIDKI